MNEAAFGSAIIHKAARDAHLLIAHVTRQGKALEPDDLAKLVEVLEKIEADTVSSEDEARFWKLYADLTRLAEPATIDSLYFADYISSLGPPPIDAGDPVLTGIKKHQAILKKIGRLSLLAFILTLVFLAYLSITESLIARNEELGREYRLLSFNVWQGTSIQQDVERANVAGSTRAETGGSAEGEAASPAAARPTLSADAQGIIGARRNEIRQLVSVNDRLLQWLRLGLAPIATPESRRGLLPYDVASISAQRNLNVIISSYILPTIAAVLGVTVFLLRTASTRITELSFKSNDADVYWHRLVLGVVGGIAISWFTVTDTTGILKSITPAALAFLVGYSVEVLYNILDSLVKALGGSKA